MLFCAQSGSVLEGSATIRTNGWLEGGNPAKHFDFDSDSDDFDLQPSSPSCRDHTSESSEVASSAATYAYNQMKRRVQKERAERQMLEQDARQERQRHAEERQRHAEELAVKNARLAYLENKVRALARDNPEAKQLLEIHDRTSKLAEARRRRCRALRQQIVRSNRSANKRAFREYTEIQLGNIMRCCEPGGKVLMTMGSIADSKATAAEAAEQRDAQQAGSKRKWKFSKFASKHVLVRLPSPFVSRVGEAGAYIGGLQANPKRLIATVVSWSTFNVSVSAVARMASNELAAMAESVQVAAQRHRGQTASTRRSFPGNSGDESEKKLVDVFGSFCEKTVTQAIHAFNTTIDWLVAEEILSADGIHLALDISTFSIFHQQSIYLFAFWVKETGKDAAGNPKWAVTTKECFLPSIAVGEKLSRRLRDTAGNLFATSTTRAAATSLTLSNLLSIVNHKCVSLGVDGGGEGAGFDDPSSAENSRANKNGC